MAKVFYLCFLGLTFGLVSFLANASPECQVGVEAFRVSVYPLLRTRCVACHGDGGRETQHAQEDVAQAYVLSRPLANFTDSARSRFIRKVRQEHWLDYDPQERGATESEMLAALTDWWERGEKDCPPPFNLSTEKVSLGRDLPWYPGGFLTVRWELSGSGSGCSFLLDVQNFSAAEGEIPGSLRVSDPRLNCVSGTTSVRGLRVLVDGQSSAFENIYDDLQHKHDHDGSDVFLSREKMILIPGLSTTKSISVGFIDFVKSNTQE